MARQPKFVQLDPDALQKQAIDYNTTGYKLADEDAYKRLGGLYPARDAAVANAAADLTGQDPIYNQAFEQSGLGPIDLGPNAEARSVALRQPVLSGAQRNRTFFENMWKQNPKRSFGLGTGDLVNIAASNSGNAVQFQSAVNQINANNAQTQQQEQAALIGTLIKGAEPIVNSTVNAIAQPSSYLDPGKYNYAPPGGYTYNPFAPSTTGGAYEGTIDNMPVYRAEKAGGGW